MLADLVGQKKFVDISYRLPDCTFVLVFSLFHESSGIRKVTFFTYARYIVVIANTLLQEPVANFPGEDRGTFSFIIGDFIYHRGCRHPWFAAADRPWLDRAGLVVSAKDGIVTSA